MDYIKQRDEAAQAFNSAGLWSPMESPLIGAFKAGADWHRAKAERLVEALKALSEKHHGDCNVWDSFPCDCWAELATNALADYLGEKGEV